jgi:ankyrin repeat protein
MTLGRIGQSLIGVLCVTMLATAATQDARLSRAAMEGDMPAVGRLLGENADVNGAQGDGTTALHWAAYTDDAAMARLLIQAGADLAAETRLGALTPLLIAAKSGNAAILGLMLEAGADANLPNTQGTTPLMLAAASGITDAVQVLLGHGADVNATESAYGQTATMFAAALNRSDVIRLLAADGANLDITSEVHALHSGGERERRAGRPGRGSPSRMGGNTALHLAAREGQMAAVRALVEVGASVNQVSALDEMSAMTTAIMNSHFDVGKFLLDAGADPSLASDWGLAPLYATIDAGYAQRTWYPPLSTDQEQINHVDLMKALIVGGAKLNTRITKTLWFRRFGGGGGDATGATAFWRAAQANDVVVMRLLVAAGADPNIYSTAGVSPLQVAGGFGISHQGTAFVPDARMATIRYLVEELAADATAKDSRGYTALHGVGLVGDNAIVEYLVAAGADASARAGSVSGREEVDDRAVAMGTGDSVADYANGPSMNARVYPDTIALLISLGSEFSDNCRASVCVLKTKADSDPGGRRQQ